MLRELQALIDAGQLSLAIDLTYDTLDDLLLSGKFSETEAHLMTLIQNSQLPLAVRLSALTITTPWRQRFEYTHTVLKRSLKSQAFAIGGQEKVNSVFRGVR